MSTEDITKYYGPMGPHTNALIYNELEKKVFSKDGTSINVGTVTAFAGVTDAFKPAEPHVPEMVKDIFTGTDKVLKTGASKVADFLSGPFAGTSSPSISPAPVYNKNMAYSIRDKFGSMLQNAVDNPITALPVLGISNSIAAVGTVADKGLGAVDSVVKTIASPIGKGIDTLNEYTAPTVKTLENFSKIGAEFDKIIKDTFFGQMFNIKGTEIICTLFCIVISFLSCKTRDKLYNMIKEVNMAMSKAVATVAAVNEITAVYNTAMAGARSVTEAAKGLFGNKSGKELITAPFKTTSVGMSGIGGASTVIAAPEEVRAIIEKLTKLLQMITKARITIPVGYNGEIWDMAMLVLYSLQSMVMQMADEMLTRNIKPIEDQIRQMQPTICIGNMASVLFNKIIAAIRAFKAWILQQIAELFGSSKAFGVKWKTYDYHFKGLQTYLAILQALSVVLGNFSQLAMSCGVQPCNNGNIDKQLEDLTECVRGGGDVPLTNIPAIRTVVPGSVIDNPLTTPISNPKGLDQIAAGLAPILKVPLENIVVTPDLIQVAVPGIDSAPPKMISSLIASEQFALELGPSYTIYSTPDSPNVKIVYSFKRSCGD